MIWQALALVISLIDLLFKTCKNLLVLLAFSFIICCIPYRKEAKIFAKISCIRTVLKFTIFPLEVQSRRNPRFYRFRALLDLFILFCRVPTSKIVNFRHENSDSPDAFYPNCIFLRKRNWLFYQCLFLQILKKVQLS